MPHSYERPAVRSPQHLVREGENGQHLCPIAAAHHLAFDGYAHGVLWHLCMVFAHDPSRRPRHTEGALTIQKRSCSHQWCAAAVSFHTQQA